MLACVRPAIALLAVLTVLCCVHAQPQTILVPYDYPGMPDTCSTRPLSCDDQSTHPVGNIERILVIAAHPDDIESCAGGTVARMIQLGVEVRYILLTNGDRGTSNRSMTPEILGPIREQEQRNAAAVLGVKSVDFLGLEDGSVVNTDSVQKMVTRLIRRYQPTIIFTWDPSLENHYDLYIHGFQHADHRATGQIVLDVVYPKIRDFLYWPELINEGYEPWQVHEVYLFSWQVDLYEPKSLFAVDITSTFDLKMKSLLQHTSQISNPAALVDSQRSMCTKLATASMPPVTGCVEWFKRVLFM